MSGIKIDRKLLNFVTEIGTASFTFLFPGQAQDSMQAGSKAYKLELIVDPVVFAEDRQRCLQGFEPMNPLVKAAKLLAVTHDPNRWFDHVFGRNGCISLLEELEKRDHSKYPYAQGKYVLRFSQVWNLKTLGMKDANLADPATRSLFDKAVALKAPGVFRFANPASPADVAKIEQVNAERAIAGLPAVDITKGALLPMQAHEFWPGCKARVSGRAYWHDTRKAIHLSFDHVLFVAEGERLVGESSPDAAFGAFAPPSELAPPAPAAAQDPWASLV